MKFFLIILITIGSSPISFGCIISPYQRAIMYSDDLKESSDVIFFGKLAELKTKESGEQLATFFVIKSFKGNLEGRVKVKNEILSSCFRPFQNLNSAYYIFGSMSGVSNIYEVGTSVSNGFIPLEYAVSQNWSFK